MRTDLQVNQVNGRMNLNIKPPNMKLQTKHAADFSINNQRGNIKVNTKSVKVDISTRKARAELGHKFYKIYGKEIAQKGIQASMRGIAEYARQGDQLAQIEKGGNPIASQAKANAQDPKRKIGLKWLPGPEIKTAPGDFKATYTQDKLNIESKSYWPKGKLDWGKIEAYLDPEPKFEVKAVDVKA